MELTTDFTDIQGILFKVEKRSGNLSKIRFKGGNEEKILDVNLELHKFLSSKNYIVNNRPNDKFEKELKDIVCFLTLNTEFNSELDMRNYSHLINMTPRLSKCLLANVVVALNLSKHYDAVIQLFPVDLCEEIFVEFELCLKKCKLKDKLDNIYFFLQSIIRKISQFEKINDKTEKLSRLASMMLLQLTGIQPLEQNSTKLNIIYEHMGHSILKLLNLLDEIDKNNIALLEITDKLLTTCCSILKAVTIDVFCTWAEIEIDENEVLQILIAEKSYLIIEKYQKFPPAKELTSMLSSIAKKPKSLQEIIQQSNLNKIASKINSLDPNQKTWFKALINDPKLFENRAALDCLSKWAMLCDQNDITKLLELTLNYNSEEINNLIIKCVLHLNRDEISSICVRHFYKNGVKNNLKESIKPELILLFNKLQEAKLEGEFFSRDLFLLILQNPSTGLKFMFCECLKSPFYTQSLKETFLSMREIIKIRNLGIECLIEEIANFPPENNISNYIELFNTLIETKCFTIDVVVLKIVFPFVQKNLETEFWLGICNWLNILNSLSEIIYLKEESEDWFVFLLCAMKRGRCKFFEFDGLKHGTVKQIVEYFDKYTDLYYMCWTVKTDFDDDPYVEFYKKLNRSKTYTLLDHLSENVTQNTHAETVCHLIKILPMCVTSEWMSVSSDLCIKFGNEGAIDILTDFMVLLCQLINHEREAQEITCMTNAIKCYIQNFGIVIKDLIQPQLSLEEDKNLTKKVCKLLKEIPSEEIKMEDGLNLASILSERSLKALVGDTKFARLLASIKEPHICQMLAQKVLK